MKIAVLGAGNIGGNIGRRLAAAGHEVTVSFARDGEALRALASEIGARTASPREAVDGAEVVVFSVPWDAIPAALAQAGSLAGKIVIDTTNQFGAGPKPPDGRTAAAFNAQRMPGARYTKSFNTLTAAFQAQSAGRARERRVVQWLAGDDAEAKVIVSRLIEEAGYEPLDVGSTRDCAFIEAPRRDGAVYGEEYRLADGLAALEAVRAGAKIPPTPRYDSV